MMNRKEAGEMNSLKRLACLAFTLVILTGCNDQVESPAMSMSRLAPTPMLTPAPTAITTPTDTSTPTPRPTPTIFIPTPMWVEAPGIIRVTAVKLYRDYQVNEFAADKKYKGKYLYVTGVVQKIGTDWFDDAYVELDVEWAASAEWSVVYSVKCYFEDRYRDDLAQLRVGHKITVLGELKRKGWSDVILEKCCPPN